MKTTTPPAHQLFTADFILIWVTAFFAFASFNMLLPILPLYVVNIGGTESQVGLVVGIITVTSVTVRPWIGRESDLRGRTLILLWGTVALAISAVSYTLATTVPLLLVLRLFHGIPWAATTTTSPALVADISPPKRRGEAMGWYGTASSVAMAIAPILAVFLVSNYGFNPTFLLGAAMAAIALGAAARVQDPGRDMTPADTAEGSATPTGSPWQMIIYRPALLPSITMLIIALTYGSIVSFFPLLAYRNDVNPGIFFSVYAVLLIVSRPLGGRIADIAGRSAAIIPGSIAIALALALLAFATDLPHFLVSAAVYGIGFAFVNPSLMALTADRAAPEARGAAMGTFSAAFDLGIGLGAILLGLLLERTSFQVLYLTSAGIAIASMIIYVSGARRR